MYSTYLGKVSEPGARPEKTMKRAKSLLLSGCCLVLNFLCHVQCEENQQYGDVSFKCPARQDENRHDANLRGQVTITYGNSSIPLEPFYVCYNYDDPYKSFNRGAAAAICRQKGFVDAEAVATNSMKYCGTPHMIGCLPESNEPVRGLFISHVLCPNVSDYARYGELHVMRCSVGEIIDNFCVPVSIICSSRKLDSNSYNGMISVADPSKRGLVKIHLFDSAKYICFPDNADVVGSSMCRQIGYTSASLVLPSSDWPRDGESAYQFSSVYCNNETGSYQCFSHCINQTEVTSSSDCQNVLSLACSYDPSTAELMTSGSLSVCSLQVSTNTSTSPYFISTIVLAAVFGVENIPICLICTVCLIKKYWRRRCHWWWHRQEYNDHNRPNANEHLALFQNNNNHN